MTAKAAPPRADMTLLSIFHAKVASHSALTPMRIAKSPNLCTALIPISPTKMGIVNKRVYTNSSLAKAFLIVVFIFFLPVFYRGWSSSLN